MFEIGWTEMLVIAVVMIVVVGPKDLPSMLRTFGKTTKKLRAMAGDFQKQFNDALKEAELDDVKKSVDSLRSLNPVAEIKKQLNPFEKAAAEVRSGLDAAMKPTPKPADPAIPVTHTAEPLKSGAANMPAAGAPAVAAEAGATFPAMADPAMASGSAMASAAAQPAASKPAKASAKPAAKTSVKPGLAAKAAAPAAAPAASKPAKASAKPAAATNAKPAPAAKAVVAQAPVLKTAAKPAAVKVATAAPVAKKPAAKAVANTVQAKPARASSANNKPAGSHK